MLENSFIFLPRVGETTERRLWQQGLTTWDHYIDAPVGDLRGIGAGTKRKHAAILEDARAALPKDPAFFASRLPSGEQWRAFGEYGDRALYLDIETTGPGHWARVTVVGVRGPGGTRCLVHGDDLEKDTVESIFSDASMIVTFNGASFDLPMLRAKGIQVPDIPHLDLRWALRRLGHTGGLKRIERELGLARHDELADLSGEDAVRLWHLWEKRGDDDALRTLLAYNRADVENMEPLAQLAYERLRDASLPAAAASDPPASAPRP